MQSKPSQNSKGIFHRNRTNIPNICVETQRPLKSQTDSEKGKQAGGISLPDFTLHYEATVTKKVCNWHRNTLTPHKNRIVSPETDPHKQIKSTDL